MLMAEALNPIDVEVGARVRAQSDVSRLILLGETAGPQSG